MEESAALSRRLWAAQPPRATVAATGLRPANVQGRCSGEQERVEVTASFLIITTTGSLYLKVCGRNFPTGPRLAPTLVLSEAGRYLSSRSASPQS